MGELAGACREAGVRLCFYYSILDWHHPDYLPRQSWDNRAPAGSGYGPICCQHESSTSKELLTNYGPIGIIWFDGEWESTWNHERGKDLYEYLRGLQPDLIVNNRVDSGREGMSGMNAEEGEFAGDYGTPEQEIPANGVPGEDWESCMTMNDTWGFSAHDHNWKSSTTLIQNLVDCASKGGNYLLNVGPTSLGEIPEASVQRLSEVGEWMKKNSESIYGTVASPFPEPFGWGRVVQKPGKLYLHVFDHAVKSIELPELRGAVRSVDLLCQPSAEPISFTQDDAGVKILLPSMPVAASTVLVVKLS